jgi:hypothetical protein
VPSDPYRPTPAIAARLVAAMAAKRARMAGSGDGDDGPPDVTRDRDRVGRGKDWSPGFRRLPNGRWVFKAISEE